MKTIFAGIGLLAVLLIMTLFAVCGDDGEESYARYQLVSHERERCYDGDYCGDQDYDQWNNEDRNRNRNRNRGAFSPGPFDDSPVDAFNGNTVCLPGSTCYGSEDPNRRDDQGPGDQEPRSVGCLVPFPYHCDPKPQPR